MSYISESERPGFALRGVAAAIALACAGGASAFEIETDNPDLRMRWDNTVRYTAGVRVEGQDKRLLRNPVYDEGDSKFDPGELVTNRVDLLSEFDVNYRGRFGARITGAAWYDNAYDDHSVTAPTGTATAYRNNTYNNEVKRFVNGPSGEILDAFVWTNFDIGAVPVNLKLGQQTNVWGEGLLIGAHAISYSQSPVDGVKAVTNPGIETKEVFLPIGQLHASAQVTDSVTLVGQYFYDWEPLRVPHAGTLQPRRRGGTPQPRLQLPQFRALRGEHPVGGEAESANSAIQSLRIGLDASSGCLAIQSLCEAGYFQCLAIEVACQCVAQPLAQGREPLRLLAAVHAEQFGGCGRSGRAQAGHEIRDAEIHFVPDGADNGQGATGNRACDDFGIECLQVLQ